eukprot:NODE_1275_length_1495_cov_2.569848_g1060_i0.p8 GENE.NODE_1275_length_1495_cov_2.569848_g1060_i0~~NODE_1275_length_1495_cov_2.569848_g1060_i0.p8  ORF type:complete len:62 (+),score=1.78 NODE_1275_length_1495_cov_2.569848_g1060_i0:118-303(+)
MRSTIPLGLCLNWFLMSWRRPADEDSVAAGGCIFGTGEISVVPNLAEAGSGLGSDRRMFEV